MSTFYKYLYLGYLLKKPQYRYLKVYEPAHSAAVVYVNAYYTSYTDIHVFAADVQVCYKFVDHHTSV